MTSSISTKTRDAEDQERGKPRQIFSCSMCEFSSPYDYFGNKPIFLKSVVLLEEAYVMKDPFTPENRHLMVGGHCSQCNKAVCASKNCSVFYTRRFCMDCAREYEDEFPKEIQQEITKDTG